MSASKKRIKRYKPRDPDSVKLKFQLWKVAAVVNPIKAIITELEQAGTINTINDEPVFSAGGDWYQSSAALLGVVEAYEIHERRTGADLHLDGLRKLANTFAYRMNQSAAHIEAAKVSLHHIQAATLEMTAGYAKELLRDFHISEAVRQGQETV